MSKKNTRTQKNTNTQKELRTANKLKEVVFSLGLLAWRWAAYALLLVTLLVWLGIIFSIPPASPHSWFATLGFALIAAIAALLLGNLAITILNLFQKIPEMSRWLLAGTVFLLYQLLMPIFHQPFNVLAIIAYVVIFSSLLGAGIGGLIGKTAEQKGRRRLALGLLLSGGIGILGAASWFFWPGPSHEMDWLGPETTQITPLTLDDPSRTGPFPVLTLTYGSGSDKQRPEYAAGVAFETNHVDVSPMVKGGRGFTQWLRQSYWGFDLTRVPLNARVWYPGGAGPFPLVLVVHGNHSMDDFSDPGYAYLGELLASRGYIVASVDQNFLNGAGIHEAVLGGLEQENDARGYLLLQHLMLWHQWHETEDHPFKGKVDTGKIALIGHSRGGEAAAIAAAFNHLPAHPDNAMIPFDFGFDIGAVIAIAPSDGKYQPRQRSTPLEDINYLVLQGSADSDVRSFVGSRQYDRISYPGDKSGFKAAVYIHGANHGQFNSRWGRIDLNAGLWFLNRNQIMPQAEQEAMAKVFISGFLEAALHGQQEYAKLFENPLSGQRWLPETIYLAQFQSSNTLLVAAFEEDLNLATTTVPGGKLWGDNLTVWREEPPTLGTDQLRDTVSLRLGWHQDVQGQSAYSLQLPPGLALDNNYALTFALANLLKDNNPLDLTIRVTDQAGQEASLPLSHLAPLPPALTYRMFKPPLRVAFEAEPIFTTYGFELRDFSVENSNLNLSSLKKITFVFDRSPAGEIYLDDVGFRPL